MRPLFTSGQEKKPLAYKVQTDTSSNKITIEFNPVNPVNNFLITLTDSLGNTIFLENRYRLKEGYKRSVDLTGKGKFFLNIQSDEEKFTQTIINN
jgi:hypothetical protein